MQRGHAPFSLDRNGYHISWDTVPAWICEQCGEPLFEAPEVDIIRAALSALDRETAALTHQLPHQPDDLISAKQAS